MDTNNTFQFTDDEAVTLFIREHNEIFNQKLTCYFSYSRVACLADFQNITKQFEINHVSNIAVVSGSTSDPELELISNENLDILDYDSSTNSFNLDEDWSSENDLMFKCVSKYDFVLCSQVFEHIYSPLQGLKNLSIITRPGGYIWVSIPTINCIHGEPNFYSAGYHPRYLNRLGKDVDLECLYIGAWGNKKYLSAAVLGRWLTHDQLLRGFHSSYDLVHPKYTIIDGRINDCSGKFITDCWALFRKQ